MQPDKNEQKEINNPTDLATETVDKEFTPHFTPSLFQLKEEMTCYINLPGILSMNDIMIDVIDCSIHITANAQPERCKESELSPGLFHYKIDLPFNVRIDQLEAEYHSGFLILHLSPDEITS